MELWAGGQRLLSDVQVAESFFERLRGMIGRQITALWIPRCGSVHTYFMAKSIDILFLDREFVVVAIAKNVPPRRVRFQKQAVHVLELDAGLSDRLGFKAGEKLSFM